MPDHDIRFHTGLVKGLFDEALFYRDAFYKDLFDPPRLAVLHLEVFWHKSALPMRAIPAAGKHR